jgi:hypothetical protein
MKITILIFSLFLTAMTGLSMVALLPAGGTNELAAIERANRINVEWASYYYNNGRVDRLEHEVNRLETGFVIVAVLIGSTFSALIVLAARDQIRERKSIQKNSSEQSTNGLRQKTD